jgi:hypothetical protein
MKLEAVKQERPGCEASSPAFRALSLLIGSALLVSGNPSMAQTEFESPPTFRASKILPPDLLAGPDYRIVERVVNDGFMNIYTINSRFGTFIANSDEELRIRVGEINAIARMEDWAESEQFVMGVGKAGRDVLDGSTRLVTDPVGTFEDTASGVKEIFESARRGIGKVGDKVRGKDSGEDGGLDIKETIGYSRAKRQYAAAFGVDPYSTNLVVQAHLERLSRAGFVGDVAGGAALSFVDGGVGMAISVAGHLQSLKEQVRDKSPDELRDLNEKKLQAMGVEQSVIDLYLGNYVFSPTYQTAFVATLEEIDAAADRGEFVKVAVLAKDEDQALFRLSQVRMYANFHKTVKPLQAFVLVSELVVVAARTADGALVVNVPADHVFFTSSLAGFFRAARSGLDDLAGVSSKQLWIAGGMSPMAKTWIEESGWTVHTDAKKQLLSGI